MQTIASHHEKRSNRLRCRVAGILWPSSQSIHYPTACEIILKILNLPICPIQIPIVLPPSARNLKRKLVENDNLTCRALSSHQLDTEKTLIQLHWTTTRLDWAVTNEWLYYTLHLSLSIFALILTFKCVHIVRLKLCDEAHESLIHFAVIWVWLFSPFITVDELMQRSMEP